MGLTNHGYQLLTKWDDPPSIGIIQTPQFGITNLEIDLQTIRGHRAAGSLRLTWASSSNHLIAMQSWRPPVGEQDHR